MGPAVQGTVRTRSCLLGRSVRMGVLVGLRDEIVTDLNWHQKQHHGVERQLSASCLRRGGDPLCDHSYPQTKGLNHCEQLPIKPGGPTTDGNSCKNDGIGSILSTHLHCSGAGSTSSNCGRDVGGNGLQADRFSAIGHPLCRCSVDTAQHRAL